MKVSLHMWPDLITTYALLTLAAYNLLIYVGRKREPKEIYNLYFAYFVFSAAFFIIAPYFQQHQLLNAIRPDWLNVINIEMFSIWLLFLCGIKFLHHLLAVSPKFIKKFRFIMFSISVGVLLTLTSNFISKEFYFKHVLILILIIVALNVVLMNFLYGYWIYREGLYKEKFIRIFYFGYLLLTFNLLTYRAIELRSIPFILVPNHYLTAFILFVFTYALSVKFNKEYRELIELKLQLVIKNEELPVQFSPKHATSEENYIGSMVLFPTKNYSPSIDDQFLLKAFEIIEKNINDTDFNAEKFSEEIGISRAHLYRKLKTLTNQSATEFIRSIRLKRAAELLNQKAASVSEIAYITGFNNLSYFTRRFKEEFGITPSEYFSKSNAKSKTMKII